nr:MAG TPA: hypothetical protein [Caudoviricetes sp.]
MTDQSTQPENGMERLFGEFAEACLKNPSLDQATRALRESVFAAAGQAGVNPSEAFGIIFRDMMMLEYFQKRVDDARASLADGKLPAFVIEEARPQQ